MSHKGQLVAVIGDEDTVTGFLLAGVGERSARGTNWLIVDKKTRLQDIEAAFKTLTSRSDVAIVLINQFVANSIRHLIQSVCHGDLAS